jgi:hypothetical protein
MTPFPGLWIVLGAATLPFLLWGLRRRGSVRAQSEAARGQFGVRAKAAVTVVGLLASLVPVVGLAAAIGVLVACKTPR